MRGQSDSERCVMTFPDVVTMTIDVTADVTCDIVSVLMTGQK